MPLVPILAILASVYLMLNLPLETWVRFLVWMAVGVVLYYAYGARHSRLATDPAYAASTCRRPERRLGCQVENLGPVGREDLNG